MLLLLRKYKLTFTIGENLVKHDSQILNNKKVHILKSKITTS